MFRVYKGPKFQKEVEKLLTKSEQEEMEKFITDLKKGDIHGKPLTYDYFREKKIGGKRLYFLIYQEIEIVLLISVSTKKYQQETIDEIKWFLPQFKEYAYKLKKTNIQ